jgi:hypothetical protein
MDAPTATKKRGRPPKVEVEDISSPALVEPLQMVDIKHVFRVLSTSGTWTDSGPSGPHPVEVVEDHLRNNYLNQGYVLLETHHIRVVIDRTELPVGHELMYVFVKYAQ